MTRWSRRHPALMRKKKKEKYIFHSSNRASQPYASGNRLFLHSFVEMLLLYLFPVLLKSIVRIPWVVIKTVIVPY